MFPVLLGSSSDCLDIEQNHLQRKGPPARMTLFLIVQISTIPLQDEIPPSKMTPGQLKTILDRYHVTSPRTACTILTSASRRATYLSPIWIEEFLWLRRNHWALACGTVGRDGATRAKRVVSGRARVADAAL
jgi:hypothetical protein